jgi:hypothetical protein
MLADCRKVPNSGPWKQQVRTNLFPIVITEPAVAVLRRIGLAAPPFGIGVGYYLNGRRRQSESRRGFGSRLSS